MKIIFVTPFFRIPADFGLAIRDYHIIKHLALRHELVILLYGKDPSGSTDRWLYKLGCQVHRVDLAYEGVAPSGYLDRIRELFSHPPGSFKRFTVSVLRRKLEELLRQHPEAEIILFNTQLTGQAILINPPPVLSVLMLADVYSIQLFRQITTIGLRPSLPLYLVNWLKVWAYERKVLGKFKTIITVSSTEQSFVQRQHPRAAVHLIPNGVDTTHYTPAVSKSNAVSPTLLFVGGFEYGPNVDAFWYFYEQILPLIQKWIPEVRLLVVGRNPPAAMRIAALKDPSVEVTGTVADTLPYYRKASLVIVPLRLGSGTKIKLLEAFAAGVAVISTSVGVEGVACTPGIDVAVADTPESFAAAACQMLDDTELATTMAEKARQLVEQHYSWASITSRLEIVLDQVVSLATPV